MHSHLSNQLRCPCVVPCISYHVWRVTVLLVKVLFLIQLNDPVKEGSRPFILDLNKGFLELGSDKSHTADMLHLGKLAIQTLIYVVGIRLQCSYLCIANKVC